MTHPVTRAAAWVTPWVPQAVLMEAMEQLHCSEALAIAATRHRLQIRELQEQIEALEREIGR